MDLHNKYGTVVRVAPDELSFSSPDAWEEVYGRYKAGKRKENMKPGWYASRDSNDILGAELGDHGRIRKILNFGFTASAMLDQEPAIAGFVDLLFERLRARAGDTSVDVWKWYLYTLFDITGNLACKQFKLNLHHFPQISSRLEEIESCLRKCVESRLLEETTESVDLNNLTSKLDLFPLRMCC